MLLGSLTQHAAHVMCGERLKFDRRLMLSRRQSSRPLHGKEQLPVSYLLDGNNSTAGSGLCLLLHAHQAAEKQSRHAQAVSAKVF